MEVTSANFQEVLVELDDVLKNATFLTIDGEFTGLHSGPDTNVFDTPAQLYAKLRAGSMDFLLVQFGLSVFKFDSKTEKYSHRSYNFYVFPRPLNRAASDCRFMCQTSCIAFLIDQGFDFNKLFKLGIPYLNKTQKERLIKRLEDEHKLRDEAPLIVPISDTDRPQIEEICTRIDEFITSDAKELIIEKCNAFIRRLVCQEVRTRWPDKLNVESKMGTIGYNLVIQRSGTKEEEERRKAEKKEREIAEIENAAGLGILMQKIADSGKLIVGHNLLLDLCHIVHHFFGPLPKSYVEFKSLVHSLFPRIIDTKIICCSQQMKENVPSSNLNELLEIVNKSPFQFPEVESVDDRSYSMLTEKRHEAGYDAYITGICFIALLDYLKIPMNLAELSLFNPFLNKIPIGRLKDVPYINLVEDDPNPNRDHILHITFPKDWTTGDLGRLFNPFGGAQVSWLNDTSAYIGLNCRDQVNTVVKTLSKTNTYSIQRYADYQASLETNVNTMERKRKLPTTESVSARREELFGNERREDNSGQRWQGVATGKRHRTQKTE